MHIFGQVIIDFPISQKTSLLALEDQFFGYIRMSQPVNCVDTVVS